MKTMKKAQEVFKEQHHQNKIEEQELTNKIQQVAKDNLLPAIREKAEEVSQYLEKVLKEKDSDGLTATQILALITKRSTSDIAYLGNKGYTKQELAIAFNIYVDMIQEINKHCKFPPNKGSFCQMLGISRTTYDNYMEDPDKYEIMHIIDDYISTSLLTSAQLGELREISSIFTLKSGHGFVEQQAPTVIEYKKTESIDDIKSKLASIKGNVKEAEWSEVDE